ncbi:MAG TPA: histidine kinase, partial [Chitinophagaceae bacterium]|nr:histidine kinase [Chitinophagaceae bacterium]
DLTMVLSSIYSDMGNYEKAFEVAQQSLQLSQGSKDRLNIILSLVQMGYLYKNIGDYKTALSYFRDALIYRPQSHEWCYRLLYNRMGDLYCEEKQYDSAYYFYSLSLRSHAESKTSLLRMGEYWRARGQFRTAETYFNRVYRELKNTGEGNLLIFALLGLGKTSIEKKDPNSALRYGYEALGFARQRDTRLTLRDAYQLLYLSYDALQVADSAYYYYKQYVLEKDAIITDQFKGKLYAYKQSSRIKLLENEKWVSEQKLKGNQLLRNILLGGFSLLFFLGMIIFWNISLKRKNEKLQYERVQAEFKRQAGELEMQALRAQMNPHFIFNALSSVNRFILMNDPEKASDYLTRFSRLIRLVLINSQKEVILLEKEIEMLSLYLQLEQLRFKNAFEYYISFTENIDPSSIYIPPLLLQPFCENAIWHGLIQQKIPGQLSIDFTLQQRTLQCTITDNGIGRKKAAELASKSAEKIKSLGLQLTEKRLALFNQDNTMQTSYTIEDILEPEGTICGTKVNLQIRYQSIIHQPLPVTT